MNFPAVFVLLLGALSNARTLFTPNYFEIPSLELLYPSGTPGENNNTTFKFIVRNAGPVANTSGSCGIEFDATTQMWPSTSTPVSR